MPTIPGRSFGFPLGVCFRSLPSDVAPLNNTGARHFGSIAATRDGEAGPQLSASDNGLLSAFAVTNPLDDRPRPRGHLNDSQATEHLTGHLHRLVGSIKLLATA